MVILGVFRLLRERSAFIEPADIRCNVSTGSFSRRLCKIKKPKRSPSVTSHDYQNQFYRSTAMAAQTFQSGLTLDCPVLGSQLPVR